MDPSAGALRVGNEICVLQGHTGDVNCTTWSPTLRHTLCSCSGDRTLRVWKVDTNTSDNKAVLVQPDEVVQAHKFYVNSCAYHPSGAILATTSSDDTVKIWSTASWACVGVMSLHTGGVRNCCFSLDGNLLASASDDTTVKVWEVSSLKCITTITTQAEGVTCCQFAPNGWLLAIGDNSGVFLLFDAFSGKAVSQKQVAHDGGVRSIALQPPEKSTSSEAPKESVYLFATGGEDFSAKVWKVQCSQARGSVTVTKVAELIHHTGPVYSCDFHHSLPYFVTGSGDKSIILWNTTSFDVVQRIQAHSRYVTHVRFSPCGLHLATSSNDRTVKVWSLEMPPGSRLEGLAKSSKKSVVSVEPSPKTPSLVSAESWYVGSVCKWAETVVRYQNNQTSVHPDDLSAVHRLRQSLEKMPSISKVANDSVAEEYKCPITCESMRDPVVAADGYSYERSAITEWFSKGRRTSPVTNLPLTSTLLLPNRVLKALIDKHK